MIPANSIQRLKEAIPLAALIGEYVPLKKAGASLKALCPFHKEDTPSFVVNATWFHCFGCQAGGDAITFYSKIENVSPSQAIRQLAERYGVSLEVQHQTRRQRVYDREEREFALWWQRRTVEAMAARLTEMLWDASDEECEAYGAVLRQVRTTTELRALVERCATAEERRIWESYRESLRETTAWWLSLAALPWSAMPAAPTEAPRPLAPLP